MKTHTIFHQKIPELSDIICAESVGKGEEEREFRKEERREGKNRKWGRLGGKRGKGKRKRTKRSILKCMQGLCSIFSLQDAGRH